MHASLLATLALLAAPAPAPLEVVIQRPHAGAIADVWLSPYQAPRWAFTVDGSELRAWSLDGDGARPWRLRRRLTGVRTWVVVLDEREPVTRITHVLVQRPHGSELYAAEDWSAPLLDSSAGLPRKLRSDRATLLQSKTTAWRCLVVTEDGDPDGDGVPDATLFFASADGVRWERIRPPGTRGPVIGAVKLGHDTLAVRESGGTWRLLGYGAGSLVRLEASVPAGAREVRSTTDGEAAAVSLGDGEKDWLVWAGPRGWVGARALLGAGRPLADVSAAGGGVFVVTWKTAGDGPSRDGPVVFTRGDDGSFRRLEEVTPLAPAALETAAFAREGRLALLHPALAPPAAKGPPVLLARGEDGAWRHAREVVPGLPAAVRRLEGFGGGRGFLVEETAAGEKDAAGLPRVHFWMDGADGRPSPLAASIDPGVLADADAARSDDPHVLALRVRSAAGARWRHFVREDLAARFEPLEGVLRVPVGALEDVTVIWERGLVSGRRPGDAAARWFRRERAGVWSPLEPIVGPLATAGLPRGAAPIASASAMGDDAVELETMQGVRWALVRDERGRFVALAPERAEPDARHELVSPGLIAVHRQRGVSWQLRGRDGAWAPLESTVTGLGWVPRRAYAFFGGRALAVAPGPEAARAAGAPWRVLWRGDDGAWGELLGSVPGAPREALVALPFGASDGLAVQEAHARDGARRWFRFLRRGSGWAPLRDVVEGAPEHVSQARLLGGDRVLEIDPAPGGDRWYAVKGDDGRWRPLAEALPGAPRRVDRVLDAWGGDVLLVRDGAPQAAGPERWLAFVHGEGGFRPVPVRGLPAQVRDLAGEAALGILAAAGADGGWTLLRRGGDGLAPAELSGAPPRVEEVRRPPGPPRLALRAAGASGAAERWVWLGPGAGGAPAVLGETAAPAWIGFAYRRRSGGIAIDGAVHTVDGRPSDAVPAPLVWFHADADRAASGLVLLAPDRVPAGVELVGVGPAGVVLVYRSEGALHAAGFGAGSVDVTRRRGPGGEIPFIEDHLADGTTRLHRLADPTLWISRFDREVGGRIESVHFDDRGYFHSDSDRLSEVMTFRRGNELLGFDQLAAWLFRPDRLEERLRLPPGSLFVLTESDRRAIEEARRLSEGDRVDVAALEPPHVAMPPLPAEIATPTVDVAFDVEVRGDPRLRAEVRVVGQALARGGDQRELLARPRGDGQVLAADARGIRVYVPPGRQCVEVRVTDGRHLSSVARRCLERKPASGEQHDLYVAVLAASAYAPGSGFPSLPQVGRDAAAVVAALRPQEGRAYRKVHVRTWCDGAAAAAPGATATCDAPATRAAITAGVPAFLAGARDGDDAVLYVVGHGERSADGVYTYAPSDARAGEPATQIGWSALHELLARTGAAGRRLLFLDTCHAAAVASGQEEERMITQAAERENLFILAASAADASAFESPVLGNGIFTHVFKRALAGEADTLPEDGILRFGELALFLRREVDATAREIVHVHQVPHVPLLGPEADFDVARVPRTRWRVHVTALRNGDVDYDAATRWGDALARLDGVKVAPSAAAAGVLVQIAERPGGRFDLVVKRRDGATRAGGSRRTGLPRAQVVPALLRELERGSGAAGAPR